MAKVFSDTSGKDGLIQSCEDKLGFDDGVISGDSVLLAKFTSKINEGMVRAWKTIFKADGTWQFDDSNHTDYPIITTNLVANQRDYSFILDQNSNFILSVDRVLILPSSTATLYSELTPVDVQSGSDSGGLASNSTVTGVPGEYDKTANGIFLDPIPSYSATNGLKVYITREGLYFTTASTTATPGFASLFHDFPALFASYEYARDKGHNNLARLERDMLLMEKDIEDYYAKREKDIEDILTPEPIIYE